MKAFENPGALYTYRRYARECAVMACYSSESSGLTIEGSLRQLFELFESEDVQEEIFRELTADEPGELPVENPDVRELFEGFSRTLAVGAWRERHDLDAGIGRSIPSYDVERLASVDRNVLRVATWELWNIEHVPPAVTINEAVEIAKKYSTAESGKFVNGVLGTMLKRSPKANWDPAKAPVDPELPRLEEVFHPKTPAPAVEIVEEGSEEAIEAQRFGIWKLRSD